MSLSIFTHPCQRPESLPLRKVSFSTFPPPTSVTYMSVSSKSGSKMPKSHQAKCHAPFSSHEHVGSIMSNMSFHDVMSSCHVMSCHVVTLETDPCMCPCQYSPTHVTDQNPCLYVECAESQTQAKKLNSITIRKLVLQGSKVGSGHIQSI